MRAWVFVTFVLLSGSPQSLFGAETTPFKLGNQGGILVAVTLNGTGPYVWLLDTGASHSSISDDLARRIGAPPVARTTVSSNTGDRERIVVHLNRIGFGPFEGGALPTAVPARELTLAGEVEGVLGQDVLAGLRYTIDYRNRRIAWDDPRTLHGSGSIAVLPMVFTDGVPVVELSQGGSTLRLIADSGAGGLVLFDRAGRDLPAMTADGGLVRLDTFQGRGMARCVRIDRFRVGVSTLRDVPAVLINSTASPVHSGDGLLPLHIFDRVTFDGPAGRLIVG